MRTLKALLIKEFTMLRRDAFLSRTVVMLPLVVMLVLPLVTTMDVKNVEVAVVDNDMSQLSRRIIADMDASEHISVSESSFTFSKALAAIENGHAYATVTIPHGYSRMLHEGHLPKLDIRANGVDAIKGMLAARYALQSLGVTLTQWKAETGYNIPDTNNSVMYMYNPTLSYKNYMIPALMVVLLVVICGILPALNLVTEKEFGTIEAMNVTPVGKMTFVLSKLIPFWIIGLLVITLGILVGWLVYGLKPIGSIPAIYLASFIFSLLMSGLGLSVANKSSTMLQTIFVCFAVVIVFMLMGGLFTPIESMPEWAQYFTYIVPPRYFIEIMRSIYLKGASMADLWQDYVALCGFAILFLIISAFTYKKRN